MAVQTLPARDQNSSQYKLLIAIKSQPWQLGLAVLASKYFTCRQISFDAMDMSDGGRCLWLHPGGITVEVVIPYHHQWRTRFSCRIDQYTSILVPKMVLFVVLKLCLSWAVYSFLMYSPVLEWFAFGQWYSRFNMPVVEMANILLKHWNIVCCPSSIARNGKTTHNWRVQL